MPKERSYIVCRCEDPEPKKTRIKRGKTQKGKMAYKVLKCICQSNVRFPKGKFEVVDEVLIASKLK